MMLSPILLILLAANLLAFILMGADKRRARKGTRRIPEKTLFLAAFFGGIGGTAGMFLFHHKTKHWYFRIGFPVLAAVQVIALLWLFGVV